MLTDRNIPDKLLLQCRREKLSKKKNKNKKRQRNCLENCFVYKYTFQIIVTERVDKKQ